MSGTHPPASRRGWIRGAMVAPSAIVMGMAMSVAMAIALGAHRHNPFERDRGLSPAVAAALR